MGDINILLDNLFNSLPRFSTTMFCMHAVEYISSFPFIHKWEEVLNTEIAKTGSLLAETKLIEMSESSTSKIKFTEIWVSFLLSVSESIRDEAAAAAAVAAAVEAAVEAAALAAAVEGRSVEDVFFVFYFDSLSLPLLLS